MFTVISDGVAYSAQFDAKVSGPVVFPDDQLPVAVFGSEVEAYAAIGRAICLEDELTLQEPEILRMLLGMRVVSVVQA